MHGNINIKKMSSSLLFNILEFYLRLIAEHRKSTEDRHEWGKSSWKSSTFRVWIINLCDISSNTRWI